MNADNYVLTWVNTTLKNYLTGNNPSIEEVEHIIDYLVQSDTKISQMSYSEAKSNTEKWTKALQKKGQHIKEKPEDVEAVLDFKDGFKVVKLVGENAFKREGFLMRHCCASYYGKSTEVYSLRDEKNMPHATIEKDQQIKGKGNGDIHPKYIKYVVEFLEYTGMQVRDSEMAHLGYVNIEKLQKEEPALVFPELFRDKYFYKDNLHKIENKDNMSLWDIFGLFKFDANMKVKFNFNVVACVTNLKKFLSKIRNKKDIQSGGNSAKMSGGDYAKIELKGQNALAIAGKNSMMKGVKGAWIVLTEHDDDYNIIVVKSIQIDGKKIKEDTWYKLENAKFVEVK